MWVGGIGARYSVRLPARGAVALLSAVIPALALAAFFAVVVHIGGTAIAGRALGATLEDARLGYGPSLLIWRDPPVRVGCLPLGGWIRFVGAVASDEGILPGDFLALPRWRRALIPLGGPVLVLVFGAVLVGPGPACDSALRTPGQLYAAMDPQLLGMIWDQARALPPFVLFGHALTKVAAFNLLPLPTLAGGDVIITLLGLSVRLRERLTVLGALVSLALFSGLGFSMARLVWARV